MSIYIYIYVDIIIKIISAFVKFLIQLVLFIDTNFSLLRSVYQYESVNGEIEFLCCNIADE